jgi:hypothetical protein
MLRIVLGVISAFIAWLFVWVVSEKIIGAIWPAFGVHQKAFEEAIKNGGEFTADMGALLTHIVLGSIISVMAGALAALIAGENTNAPLFAGILLVTIGVMKAVMSWQYVPLWYHVIFTAILLPMAILGGRLITSTN